MIATHRATATHATPTTTVTFATVVFAMAASFTPGDASAQIKASELGSVSQTVDGTTLTVEYSRPQARGRSPLFGGVVDWGYMWTPGANWATTLETTGPITFGGEPLPAGVYSLWIEAQPDEWTVHVHPNPRLFHTGEYPEPDEFQVSTRVAPQELEHHSEVLTFGFPAVHSGGGVLRMHWGPTAIDVPFEVEPSIPPFRMTESEMAPFVGAYEGDLHMGGEAQPMRLTVAANDGRLRATIPQWGGAELLLIPTAESHRFRIGWLRDGELFQVEDEPAVFETEGDRVTGVVIYGIRNQPWFELDKTG